MENAIDLTKTPYANQKLFSDSYPFEIVEQKSPKTIVVREMKATPKGKDFENQWKYESCSENPLIKIRLRKNGSWYGKVGSERPSLFILSDVPVRFHDHVF